MSNSRIGQAVCIVFGDGLVAGVGRLMLIALCLVGVSSAFWGIPAGPVMAVAFGWFMAYIVGRREFLTGMLQPDASFWRWGWRKGWSQAWRENMCRYGIFFLWLPLLDNTPRRGVWVLPLPSAAMALQQLVDRVMKRTRPAAAGAFGNLHEKPIVKTVPAEAPGDQMA